MQALESQLPVSMARASYNCSVRALYIVPVGGKKEREKDWKWAAPSDARNLVVSVRVLRYILFPAILVLTFNILLYFPMRLVSFYINQELSRIMF